MRKIKFTYHHFLIINILFFAGCGSVDRQLFINPDGSGDLHLSHYTSSIPTLGPCGFSRSSDNYQITIPITEGRVESNKLNIYSVTTDTTKFTYSGYVEFFDSSKIDVQLYKLVNGKTIPLTINGKHKLKVVDNKIESKKL